MKILVINGSPKKEKSDTLALTKAFLEGISVAGSVPPEIRMLDASGLDVGFCKGCLSCMHNGGTCVLSDDMDWVLPEILRSDVVLFSFPLYCYGIPAVLKKLVERMLPIYSISMKEVDGHYEHDLQMDISAIRFVMISGSGFPHVEENFTSLALEFRTIFRKNATVIVVPEASLFQASLFREETVGTISLLKEAGKEFTVNGAVSEGLLHKISIPVVPPRVYAKLVNYIHFVEQKKEDNDNAE